MEYKGVREKTAIGVEFKGPLPRAYYCCYCPRCAEVFSSLGRKLGLTQNCWSGLLQEEGNRLGTTSPSFRAAAEGLNRLAGVDISLTALRRIHREAGEVMPAVPEGEEAESNAPLEIEEEPA